MRQAAFHAWLNQVYNGGTMDSVSQRSRISNCLRIERYEGDLDVHYRSDRMAALLRRLSYTKRDESLGAPVLHSVPIGGNARNGSATLRSAVQLYLQFCNTACNPLPIGAVPAALSAVRGLVRRSQWPAWEVPTEKTILSLAHAVVPCVRFLHPDIVHGVVEDNERCRQAWSLQLHARGVNPDFYLWERCACAFPGVRRHAGSKEIHSFRSQGAISPSDMPHALQLDDNDYPKQIWSFIFTGKKFAKMGPKGYALAHLVDHKVYKNRGREEFETADDATAPACLYGLYTSAANAVYSPSTLIKPTDFAGPLRNLLQRRAASMYGDFCNLLPPRLTFPEAQFEDWSLGAFSWSPPVGASDHLQVFLDFRQQTMCNLLGAT